MKELGRPISCSTELKKCLVCESEIKKSKNRSWPQYQKTAKFCSKSCGTKYQYKDGMPIESKEKISNSKKGKSSWNAGKGGYERPEHKKWMIDNGHWKYGQTFEDRFGINEAKKIKTNLSKFRKSLASPKDPKKRDYYLEVWKITNRQPLHILQNYEKRGKAKKGTDNHQVDHIIPIIEGYKKNISPDIIGNIKNLRMMHWKENINRNKINK